jgi:preprotein translocase subunit SecG
MVILITTLHVLICVFLIVVVLLQSGKAADLAGAFGGMGSQTVFGPRGSATVLSKATTGAATLFMITSLSLSIMATKQGSGVPSVFDKASKPNPAQQKQAPKQLPTSAPITVTPSTDAGTGAPQRVNVPIQQVPEGQTPTLPAPPPAPGAPPAQATPKQTK